MCGDELQQHYFTRRKEGWEISEKVRRMVEFRTGNLLDFSDDLPAGFNHLDLIICRNVFIYFNKEAILKVMAKFAGLQNEGGYLLTGHGELQGHGLSLKGFRAKIFPGSVIYQKTSAAASLADLEFQAPARQPHPWPQVTLRVLKPKGLTRTRKAPGKDKTLKPSSAPPEINDCATGSSARPGGRLLSPGTDSFDL